MLDPPIPTFEFPKACRIGLIADTHVPDRARRLHPPVFEIFRSADLILHGGDISSQIVLDQLREIAPVVAVRGNNRGDSRFEPSLPERCIVRISGNFKIAMWHGMQTPWHRLTDAVLGRSGFFKYVSERMIRRCQQALPMTELVVFGHLHWPLIHYNGTRLFVNPGRAFTKTECSCAVLEIDNRIVRVRIYPLTEIGRLQSLVDRWHQFHLPRTVETVV